MYWLIDLTNESVSLHQTLRNVLESRPASNINVDCFLLESQPDLAPDFPDVKFIRVAVSSDEGRDVARYLQRCIADYAASGAVTVFTGRRTVRAVADAAAVADDRVKSVSVAAYEPRRLRESAAQEELVAEAVDALALLLFRHGSLRMTDVRPRLAKVSPEKFGKRDRARAVPPRFVSQVVASAVARGLVELHDEGDTNPWITPTDVGRQWGAAIATHGGTISTATTATTATTPPKPQPDLAQRRPPARSDDYITTLRRAQFGPFQEVRVAAYEEIARLVSREQLTPRELVKKAVASVRLREELLVHPGGKAFPWSRFASFLMMLLRRAPVLVSGGELIRPSWTLETTLVDGLAPNWRQTLDGELICFLLEQGHAISLADADSLAGALYNSRRDEFIDCVLEVVGHLIRTGRVVEVECDFGVIALADPAGGPSRAT